MTVVIAVAAVVVGSKFGWWAAGALVVACWLGHSWYSPWTGCWWCKESPKRRTKSRKHWHACLMCDGSGKRRRLGSALLGRGLGKL